MPVTKDDALRWLQALSRVFAENRQFLTDLDLPIGDADHGINMDRGFAAVQADFLAHPPADLHAVFHNAAAVLIRTVGGASGPLYGTFFLRAASVCTGKSALDAAGVVALFDAAIEGVRYRGKAAPGDKTMLDALLPALEAMRRALEENCDLAAILQRAAAAAEAGMKATSLWQARKGRASYVGARGSGHQDPGATSSYLLLKAAADTWAGC